MTVYPLKVTCPTCHQKAITTEANITSDMMLVIEAMCLHCGQELNGMWPYVEIVNLVVPTPQGRPS